MAIVSINDLSYLAVTYQDPNRVGLNDASILDSAAEFLVTVSTSTGTAIQGLTVKNGSVVKSVDATNDRTFLYQLEMTDAFKAAVQNAGANGVTVSVTFVDAGWSDARGANGAAEVERFTLYTPAPATAAPSLKPYATLASPTNGAVASLTTLNAQRYLDVTFFSPTGAVIDASSINGDELKITGTGAANLARNADGTVIATVLNVTGNTYRYLLTPRTGVDPKDTFVAGDVQVQIAAGSWRVGSGDTAVAAARVDEVFTISAVATAATGTNALALGPLSLQGPSVTLAKTQFKGGKLILTVAIGVDVATLGFGGGTAQSSSGITARLTGLLGTFDISVDVIKALGAITGGGSLREAFDVPGKFGVQIGGLAIEIPNALKVTASGIIFTWDPNYDPAENGGARQRLLVVQQASISFPSFGITGQINPNNGPGLVVYMDGFDIGEAQLIYKPGTTGPNAMQQTSGGTGKIGIAGILEFDDLRVGVTNFKVTFGQSVTFDGTIFFASGGARFLPGKPVSAIISDRLSEPDIAPGVPNTEAIRLGLEFEGGKVKGFIFRADTLKITLGSVLTLNATDVAINTSASATEEMVSFRSVGAEVTIGSLVLGGEGRNFAFLGDGTFVTKAGFGVFISVGSATGASFKWPAWLPIKITEIGITWRDIQDDPSDFVLTLSAAVTGLQGMSGLEFSGAIEGVKIDVGLLLQGKFPIIDIGSIGVQLKGDMFGGQITAGLIGGIIKLDANGAEITSFDTTTPVVDRVFFIGVEGGFAFAGIGGFTIKFAVSELGPLGVFISASIPGGILLEPNTGLSINDFSAGVEFFKTLPSIDQPEELRGPDFQLPTAQTADQWLAGVRAQVIKQYRAIQADPSKNGFTAAFTAPMLITGGAKIFTIYASKEVFNGEIILRISTDGKLLVVGKLNFAADNLSISARLYADLSKIAAGEATVLFLADIPDQVQLLTIDGRFKMGFRNPNTGEEATFTVVDPKTGKPYVRLVGPTDAGTMGTGSLNGRGYLVVDIPGGPQGATLNLASVTDLAPEFRLGEASKVRLDTTQAPVLVDGKFWFWVEGDPTAGPVDIIWLKEAWSFTAADGQEVFSTTGAFQDANNVWQGVTSSTVSAVPVFMLPYIDVRLVSSSTGQINDAALQSFAASGATLQRRGDSNALTRVVSDNNGRKSWISLGDGKVRMFFEPAGVTAGTYTLTLATAAASWQDSTGANADRNVTFSFTLVDPVAEVVSPFSANRPAVDVHVANAAGTTYLDVMFRPTPGAGLDYASILDSGQEFTLSGLGTVGGTPTPMEIIVDANGVATAQPLTQDVGQSDADWYAELANKGVTQFRYTSTATAFTPGTITVSFLGYDEANNGEGWRDSSDNRSIDTAAQTFTVEGPTVNIVSPGANGQIDIGVLTNRGYLDVTWNFGGAGYRLDTASITDLAPEFTLGGAGLGTVKLDAGQAPVLLTPLTNSSTSVTYRYWTTGNYAAAAGTDDVVDITFIDGSWSFTETGSPAPAQASVTLTSAQWLTVNFDAVVPAGFTLDAASILDLAAEFTLSYSGQNAAKSGSGTIALVGTVAPQRIGDGNTYRYRVSGDFAVDGTQSVTLVYAPQAWSFTSATAATAAAQAADASTLAAASHSYIDIAFTPSVQVNPASAPYTITAVPQSGDITLSGAGILGPPAGIHPVDMGLVDATPLGNGVYRYYVNASQFQVAGSGQVTVQVDAGSVTDSSVGGTTTNRETRQTFTLQGTTGRVTGPADGGLVGMASLNARGFLDVTFGFPSGKTLDLDSIYDLAPEFTINAASGHAIRLDGTQAPVLLPSTGNTFTFRYFTLGSYTSGEVTVTLIAGAIGFTDGSQNTAADTLQVATPATANTSYIDIRYQPVTGMVLDADSITDPGAEFAITGEGRGTVSFASIALPVLRLTNSNTFRYFLQGDFAAGEVRIEMAPDSFQSAATDTAGVVESGAVVGNLGTSVAAGTAERFTVVVLTAALADPVAGGSVDADLLNQRGWFDVTFGLNGFDSLDVASITDLDAEFTVTIAEGSGTLVLDNSQAPVRIGETGTTYRYWYTGTFKTGKL
ncbi:MAG: hypothetical protein JNM97_01270, partial [Rhodoferax sp.]|nr:hypothetical protein [Rhodoferax sp.]